MLSTWSDKSNAFSNAFSDGFLAAFFLRQTLQNNQQLTNSVYSYKISTVINGNEQHFNCTKPSIVLFYIKPMPKMHGRAGDKLHAQYSNISTHTHKKTYLYMTKF